MSGEYDSIISIENLYFQINGIEILKNINLNIGKGEFVGLIGPNGAGKTSLLKCINGINKSDGGIKIGGTSLKAMKEKEVAKKVALMNQNTSMSFPFSSADVVLMGRYPYLGRFKIESQHDREIARKNMQYTDTLKLEKSFLNQMSGGERQRVLFAKALTQETDIILLDEPTASLDITYQEQIFKLSKELSDLGRTVVAAVHDLKIASRYCSRLVLMKDGDIIADGKPEDVITSQNLSSVYNVNAVVYRDTVTGFLDFYIHSGKNHEKEAYVHVIGGGGSATAVIRQLFEMGFNITSGVFAYGDSDLNCMPVFGIKHLVGEPFNDINEDLFNSNRNLVRKADTTIVCNMLFGMQNIRNLEVAQYARKLIIIEDEEPECRDFTGGRAVDIYNSLKKKAVVTTSARLHEVL